jgi:hypothetical protein
MILQGVGKAAQDTGTALAEMPAMGPLITDMDDLGAAGHAAADGIYALGQSASEMAGKWGDIDFGAESLWKMALASQAVDPEQYRELATTLGVATDAEIDAAIRQDELTEAWRNGEITAREYVLSNAGLERGLFAIELAAAHANSALIGTIGSVSTMTAKEVEAITKTGELGQSLDELPDNVRVRLERQGFDEAITAAKEVREAINRIPSERTIRIRVERSIAKMEKIEEMESSGNYQLGTPRVPETGLAYLHAGEAVLPVREAVAYRAALTAGGAAAGAMGGSRWRGDVNIYGATDPERVAAVMMRELQDRGMLPRTALR